MGLGEAGAGGTRGKLDLGALGGNLEPWALVLPQAEPAVSPAHPAHPAPAAADRSQPLQASILLLQETGFWHNSPWQPRQARATLWLLRQAQTKAEVSLATRWDESSRSQQDKALLPSPELGVQPTTPSWAGGLLHHAELSELSELSSQRTVLSRILPPGSLRQPLL